MRVKLTLSYAGFLMIAGTLLLAVVWVFLLRYVPDGPISTRGPFVPNRSDLERAFAPRAALALVVLLASGLVGGWILAGRMLAPLARVGAATRLAASGSLSHRIHLDGRRDEFRELADAFDAMLARLEAQVTEQQRFAANASHELRTPLTITQTLLEAARDDPARDTEALIDRLHTVNARAIALTEALLMLSRAERKSFTRANVDLSLVTEEATETLLDLAERRDITIATLGESAQVPGSPALLLQMVMNLVHNAIVHNVPGGEVWVSTAVQGDVALVTIENTGEELVPHVISTLTEPFQRGAERIRHHEAGVGLGLAIVESIVRAHDGSLALAARRGGGLRLTVRLPASTGRAAGRPLRAPQRPQR